MKHTLKFLMSACIALALILSSCSKDDPAPLAATSIALGSGGSQTAIVETALADPVEVIVKDQNGNVFKGATVKFAVTEGSVSTATATTDAGGKATVSWTLGATVGTQTLTVTALKSDGTTALTGSPISVTATATPVPLVAISLELVSGSDQSAIIETALADPVEVIVKDQDGNAFEGATVNFSVTEGSLSSASATTDANGKASVNWTLGATVGTQTLTISAFEADGTTPLSGSPLSVTATGEAVPLAATSLELVSGDGQTATKGSILTDPIVVIVKDQNGDAFPGTTVSFSVAEGKVYDDAATTDENGMAEVYWQLGSTVGTQTLTVAALKADGTTPLSGSPLAVTATAIEAALAIGDFYEGGVIYYLDNTGEHGYVCAVSDLTRAEWGCIGTTTGASGVTKGSGVQNTADIVAGCTTSGIAAELCSNLTLNGYDDWFLPGLAGLGTMYQKKAIIDATAITNGGSAFQDKGVWDDALYWSSTESSDNKAQSLNFSNESWTKEDKDVIHNVRAVRAF